MARQRSYSGLSPRQQVVAVRLAQQAAVLGFHHAPDIHYTQGPARWEGINTRKRSFHGEYPHYADCSAFVTWCLWNALQRHFGLPDIVNGQHWREGYTGTMVQHGRTVSSPLPGDAIIYGAAPAGEHTAIYTGGGLVVSHGSESGPLLLPWRYRSDVKVIKRYI